jgi:hypothetical protein
MSQPGGWLLAFLLEYDPQFVEKNVNGFNKYLFTETCPLINVFELFCQQFRPFIGQFIVPFLCVKS